MEEGPEDTIRWFHIKKTAAETAQKELDGVALELIRQFAVFEALHPEGYSPTQHVKALREVMPSVSRSSKAGLRDLVEQLAIHPKEIGERPSVPVIAKLWPGDSEAEDDGEGLGALVAAELSHVDTSNVRISEGLPPFDDEGPAGYAVYEREAANAHSAVLTTFERTLEQEISEEPLLMELVQSSWDQYAVPSLNAPNILQDEVVSRRAEAYFKGNIWVRCLISAADRELGIRRLNALMIAAQKKREMLLRENNRAAEEISELREKHELLKAAWASVDQAAEEGNAL